MNRIFFTPVVFPFAKPDGWIACFDFHFNINYSSIVSNQNSDSRYNIAYFLGGFGFLRTPKRWFRILDNFCFYNARVCAIEFFITF